MNGADLRRSNLMDLAERYDTQAQFSGVVGIDPSALSRILSGVRPLGNTLARAIENRLDLKPYWLDQAHHADQRVWLQLFCSALRCEGSVGMAANRADRALKAYKERWQ